MVIFHIDLNAFFASAEVLRDPSLAGKPVAVGGGSRRSVVSTASYEARKFGVRSAMPIHEAKRLCPKLVIVNSHFSLYEELSKQFIALISSYTNQIEQASIDECYADMTKCIQSYAKPLDLAVEIQQKLQIQLQLTCSIGIAPNKFLAKMASEMKKPNGITVLRRREVASKLWPLPIEAIGGIGRKTAPHLKKAGILTIRDMADAKNRDIILPYLGINTDTFMQYANGYDYGVIVKSHEMKSISQSSTLDQDCTAYETIKTLFHGLLKKLCERAQADRVWGNHISITVRYFNFTNMHRSKILNAYTDAFDVLYAEAMLLFDAHDQQLPIRLLGVSLNNLVLKEHEQPMNLFQYDVWNHSEASKTDALIDETNRKLQKPTLMKASKLLEKNKK